MNAARALAAAVVCGSVLAAGGCYVYTYPASGYGYATAGTNLQVGLQAPQIELIAGSLYWAPNYGADVFFYNNRWYWSDGPYWYVSRQWGSGWTYLAVPPLAFLSIPPGHARHHVTFRHPHHQQYHQYVRKHYPRHGRPQPRRPFAASRPRPVNSPQGQAHRATPATPARPGRAVPATPAQPRRGAPAIPATPAQPRRGAPAIPATPARPRRGAHAVPATPARRRGFGARQPRVSPAKPRPGKPAAKGTEEEKKEEKKRGRKSR